MLLFIGADHGGFNLKKTLIAWLSKEGYSVSDQGTHDESACHYPVFAEKVGKAVRKEPGSRGILICKTGVGMCIAANKISGIRAALLFDEEGVADARGHNDINVLCLSGKLTLEASKKIVWAFLHTQFEGAQRHRERLRLIQELEK